MRQGQTDRPPLKAAAWAPVVAIGLSTFAVVTTEMLPVGLLTPMAASLGTSVGAAGLAIFLPALLAGLVAPLVLVASGGIDRRRILIGLLGLLAVANMAAAAASSIGWLLAARVLVGFCMGGVWAVAGGLAPRLVPEQQQGLATAVIFGGVAAASVFGVPIGVLIADLGGWRVSFGVMAAFSGLVLALNILTLPPLPVAESVRPSQFVALLAQPPVRAGLIIILLLVAGHFMAYTFVQPMLEVLAEGPVRWTGLLLFAYGAAGLAGNFVAGPMAALRPSGTLALIAGGLASALLAFPLLGSTPAGAALVLVFWGFAYGGASVALQTWMMRAAPHAAEVATSLFVAAFNLAIALGAFMGGRFVDQLNLHANTLVAACLPLAALGFMFAVRSSRARNGR